MGQDIIGSQRQDNLWGGDLFPLNWDPKIQEPEALGFSSKWEHLPPR